MEKAADEIKYCVGCGAIVRRKIMKTAKFCTGSCRNHYHRKQWTMRQKAKINQTSDPAPGGISGQRHQNR